MLALKARLSAGPLAATLAKALAFCAQTPSELPEAIGANILGTLSVMSVCTCPAAAIP